MPFQKPGGEQEEMDFVKGFEGLIKMSTDTHWLGNMEITGELRQANSWAQDRGTSNQRNNQMNAD